MPKSKVNGRYMITEWDGEHNLVDVVTVDDVVQMTYCENGEVHYVDTKYFQLLEPRKQRAQG